MEDGDNVFLACRDGMCEGVVEARRRCVIFFRRVVVEGALILRSFASDLGYTGRSHLEADYRRFPGRYSCGLVRGPWLNDNELFFD